MLVNYPHDFVVLCRTGASEVLAQSRRWFTQMGLTLKVVEDRPLHRRTLHRAEGGLDAREEHDVLQAKQVLSSLPFFRLVEKFPAGARGPIGAGLHVNSTPDRAGSMEARLDRMKEELGSSLYARVVEENLLDLEFDEFVSEEFRRRSHVPPLR